MRTLQEELKCMREGLHYDAHTPEMYAYRAEVKKKLHQLNVTEYHTSKMPEVTRSLFPNSAPDFFVEPPFYCDYGDGIYAAEGVFINFGAVILDGAKVTIGRKTLIAPGVHIYTAQHPLDADEDLNNKSTEHLSADSPVKIKDLNILIAEDNDSNYLLIKKLLKDNQLTRAITGVEAIEKIKAQTFDIVFMDMRMPVMNGLEATSLFREFNQTTPIIALTANAFDSDRENALAAGCNHFMTKPVKKRELMDLLFRYFKQQPQ